jgi:hypothetical protein
MLATHGRAEDVQLYQLCPVYRYAPNVNSSYAYFFARNELSIELDRYVVTELSMRVLSARPVAKALQRDAHRSDYRGHRLGFRTLRRNTNCTSQTDFPCIAVDAENTTLSVGRVMHIAGSD